MYMYKQQVIFLATSPPYFYTSDTIQLRKAMRKPSFISFKLSEVLQRLHVHVTSEEEIRCVFDDNYGIILPISS